MKTMDLQASGFEEMNEVEMKETEGGFVWLVVGCIGIAAITYYSKDH